MLQVVFYVIDLKLAAVFNNVLDCLDEVLVYLLIAFLLLELQDVLADHRCRLDAIADDALI